MMDINIVIDEGRKVIKELFEKHRKEDAFEDRIEKDEYIVKVQLYCKNFTASIANEHMRWNFRYEGDLEKQYDDNYLVNIYSDVLNEEYYEESKIKKYTK